MLLTAPCTALSIVVYPILVMQMIGRIRGGCAMRDRIKLAVSKYADPRYLKWLLFVLGLLALLLGAAAPEGFGGAGGG
jgi:hypothetical protein